MEIVVTIGKAGDYTNSMTEPPQKNRVHRLRLLVWVGFAVVFLFLYYSRPGLLGSELRDMAQSSALLAYTLYLLLGSLRGFTLIPATSIVILAIPLFPPVPLFILSIAGILISASSVYFFAGSLHLAEYFETRHKEKTEKVRAALNKYPVSIVTLWSFFPLTHTDVICYVCGVMRVSYARFILGVFVGEGAICAFYIFAGKSVLGMLGLGS